MRVKCPGCQQTFDTPRAGRQFCPHCGIHLDVPAPAGRPAAPPASGAPPAGGWAPPGAAPPPGAPPPGGEPHGSPPGALISPGSLPPGSPPPPSSAPPGGAWGGEPAPELQPSPWERRGELGFFNAIVQTWVESTLHPTRFFSGLAPGKLSDALIYALIVTSIGTLFGYAWSGLYEASVLEYLAYLGIDPGPMPEATVGSWLFGMAFVPLGVAFYLVAGGALLHLCCMIFGCSSRGFDTTLRTLCYSTGASVFGVVPFCGSLLTQVWTTVVTIIGIRHQQQTTTGRAAGAVLLPLAALIFCCACVLLAIFILPVALFAGL